MTHALTPSAIHQALEALGDDVVTVLMPRPIIETGGEKLRIAAKNAADEVRDIGGHDALADDLEALNLEAFQAPGMAFYSNGETVRAIRMANPPVATISKGGPPLWLPVIADAATIDTAWVAVADRDDPKIYRFASGELHDFSHIITLPDYDEIEARRQVQDDVLFHNTSSSSRTRGHGGFATFHALGSSEDTEREKTDQVFYQEFTEALEFGLPPTARMLFIAGVEERVGHVLEQFDKTRSVIDFDAEAVHFLPDGSKDDEGKLAKMIAERLEAGRRMEVHEDIGALAPAMTVTLNDMQHAGQMGRVRTIYLSREDAGLREFEEDERFDFDNHAPAEEIARLQSMLADAMASGAEVEAVPGVLIPGDVPVVGRARFALESETANA